MLSAALAEAVRSNGAAGIHHAAAHLVTGRPLDRQRLAGQRGLVQHGRAAGQRPVHGNELAWSDQQPVTGQDLVELDGRPGHRPGSAARGSRCPREQRVQVAPGPAGGPGLERPPAGQHHGDHGGGKQLADRHRADDREQRDASTPRRRWRRLSIISHSA